MERKAFSRALKSFSRTLLTSVRPCIHTVVSTAAIRITILLRTLRLARNPLICGSSQWYVLRRSRLLQRPAYRCTGRGIRFGRGRTYDEEGPKRDHRGGGESGVELCQKSCGERREK